VVEELDCVEEGFLVEHPDETADGVGEAVDHRLFLALDQTHCLHARHSNVGELLVAQRVLQLQQRCFVLGSGVFEEGEDGAGEAAEENLLLVCLSVFFQSDRAEDPVAPALRLRCVDLEESGDHQELILRRCRSFQDVTAAHDQMSPDENSFGFGGFRRFSVCELRLEVLDEGDALAVVGGCLEFDVGEEIDGEEEIVVDQELGIEVDGGGAEALVG
jgi:hypothetical protein